MLHAPKSTNHGEIYRDALGLPLPSPKQSRSDLVGRATWYPYYAGYSAAFVREVLKRTGLQSDCAVLDPWNGAGTTTQVCSDLGFRAFGFDLNPAMAYVARARVASPRDIASLQHQLDAIQSSALRLRLVQQRDPLTIWFSPKSVALIRALQQLMHDLCASSLYTQDLGNGSLAFLYVCLYRATREALRGRRSKNPTWLKAPQHWRDRASLSASQLKALFVAAGSQMLESLQSDAHWIREGGAREVVIGTAKASSIALPNSSVDCVVTSPPYCTRIDYAMSTAVELAILGIGNDQRFRELRDEMTGTSTVRSDVSTSRDGWGSTCAQLLRDIESHSSKASRTYYLKTHQQYFADIFASLQEIDRCLRCGGQCVMVVQDSYYKNVHNDLPTILVEMGLGMKWRLVTRSDYPIWRTMAGLNRRAKLHLENRTTAESVLWFTK